MWSVLVRRLYCSWCTLRVCILCTRFDPANALKLGVVGLPSSSPMILWETAEWRSLIMANASAQLAQLAEPLVRTALLRPTPPNARGNVAELRALALSKWSALSKRQWRTGARCTSSPWHPRVPARNECTRQHGTAQQHSLRSADKPTHREAGLWQLLHLRDKQRNAPDSAKLHDSAFHVMLSVPSGLVRDALVQGNPERKRLPQTPPCHVVSSLQPNGQTIGPRVSRDETSDTAGRFCCEKTFSLYFYAYKIFVGKIPSFALGTSLLSFSLFMLPVLKFLKRRGLRWWGTLTFIFPNDGPFFSRILAWL